MTPRIQIPKDVHVAWERDFSFFGCFLIARQHLIELKRYLGVGYEMCAFFHDRGQVRFYRSESDEDRFDKAVTERILADDAFATHVIETLHSCTDRIHAFVAENSSLDNSNIQAFLDLVDEHFAYHLGVFWPADYLSRTGQADKHAGLMKRLDEARVYNEGAIPAIEKWIREHNQEYLLLTRDEALRYAIDGMRPEDAELASREHAAFVYFDSNEGIVLSGTDALAEKKGFDTAFVARYGFDGSTLKGKSAYPGMYRGRVRLVERFEDAQHIEKGDVLVTPMTRPEFNAYVKNAGAIITDEGAVLCHAAIVAREFKIPCVVGTKIATQVLKNGDTVDVDANSGTVHLVK